MMSLLVFILLALLAAVFVLWPLLRRERQSSQLEAARQLRLQANVRLFQEHMLDLESSLAEGRIDQAQFTQLKLEQELSLLDDEASQTYLQGRQASWGKWLLWIACLGLLVLAVTLYYRQGSSADMAIQQLLQAKQEQDYQNLVHQRPLSPEPTRALAEALEQRLKARPDHGHYWFLLARTRMELGELGTAIDAYRRVLALDPQSSLVMGELAQAIFLHDKNRTSAEVQELASLAVRLDPENTTALGLLGISAFEHKNYGEAVEFWQRALAFLGRESAGRQALEAGIARARLEAEKAGLSLTEPSIKEPSLTESPDAGLTITLDVSLSKSLVDSRSLDPDLPVFVYARAWQGPRMPLAITRLRLGDLPTRVTLSESMAMSAAATLAQAEQVELVARLALGGGANAQPGDWQGSLGPIDPRSPPSGIQLRIDQILPE